MRAPALLFLLLTAALHACSADDGGDAEYAERMAREHAGETPVANPMSAGAVANASAGVVYGNLRGTPIKGYLAVPTEGGAAAPGVIVIHEWWGLNDNVRAMADKLAAAGYAALAVDLYAGGVGKDSAGARALMQAAMTDEAGLRDNLQQAYRYLEQVVGSPKIGTIGWCFGGGWSLRTALMLPDSVDATVIYYGRLVTDQQTLRPLEMPILGLFGGRDRGIPVSTVEAFRDSLEALGKDAQIEIYPDADHAFANPSGTRYDATAAEDAWQKTLAFFAEHL